MIQTVLNDGRFWIKYETIHLRRTQNLPKKNKKNTLLPPDTPRTYVCVSGSKKCVFQKILRTHYTDALYWLNSLQRSQMLHISYPLNSRKLDFNPCVTKVSKVCPYKLNSGHVKIKYLNSFPSSEILQSLVWIIFSYFKNV